MRLNRD